MVASTAAVVALAVSAECRGRVRHRLKRVFCAHDPHLKSDAASGRIWHECWKCGTQIGEGWTVDVSGKFPTSKPLTAKREKAGTTSGLRTVV